MIRHDWRRPPDLPQYGRRIVAFYRTNDGGAQAAAILYDREASIDAGSFVLWAYLPDDFALWLEQGL